MLRSGFSPSSGKESPDYTPRHVHIQNWTTAGAVVEWAPMTNIQRLLPYDRLNHVGQLVEDGFQMVVAVGAACLPDYHQIPNYLDFLGVLAGKVEHEDVRLLVELLEPVDGISSVYGQNCLFDPFVNWLKSNERKLIT